MYRDQLDVRLGEKSRLGFLVPLAIDACAAGWRGAAEEGGGSPKNSRVRRALGT